MITIQLTCCRCGSENIVRNGLTANGKQRFLCKDCGKRSRENPQPNGYTEEEREEILRAYHERSSLRGLTRTFGVSRNTVTNWLKKKGSRTPRVERYPARPGPRRLDRRGVGVGRALVFRLRKDGQTLGLASAVSGYTPSGGLRHR